MKRRQFLKGSLTFAGLAFTGCPKSSPSKSSTKGGRKDPNFQKGHLLRDGKIPDSVARKESCEALILGAGIAGLSAGWRWSRAGLTDYKILELESECGGNSRALTYPASKAPIAAHYLPVPNHEAKAVRRLLQEMDILRQDQQGEWRLAEEHLCHSRQERIFYQSNWYEGLVPIKALSEESKLQLDNFRSHIESLKKTRDRTGKKIFALPLHYSSQEEEYLALDRISFAEYIASMGWDDPFLLWFLEYACRDDFGGNLSNCSAWAGLHYFASRDGGGLTGSDEVLVWPEGNNRLASYLEAQQKGELRCSSLVLSVEKSKAGRVLVDYLEIESGQRVQIETEALCFCLPTFMRPYLLGSKSFASFHYPPWLSANLSLDRSPTDLEAPGFIAWDNVLYDSDSLGYVVATHQSLKTDPLLPTVWTWYRPFPNAEPKDKRKELLELSWEDYSETILAELSKVHPDIRQHCQQLDITVLGHGMIRPSVDFIWSEEMKMARTSDGPIFFGHGDLSGMSLFEESQFRGVLAAESALSSLAYEFSTFL